MPTTFECQACNDYIVGGEAFHLPQANDNGPICFDCYLNQLHSTSFHDQPLYIAIQGRDLDPRDPIVFYDREGRTLARIPLSKLDSSQLVEAKEAVAAEEKIPSAYITLVLECFDNNTDNPEQP